MPVLRVEERKHGGDDEGGGAAGVGHAAFVPLLSSTLKECPSQSRRLVSQLGAVVRDKACGRLIGPLETKTGVQRGQFFLGTMACAVACHTFQSVVTSPGAVQSPRGTRFENKEKVSTPLTAFVCSMLNSPAEVRQFLVLGTS
jgi:hypothetical protein